MLPHPSRAILFAAPLALHVLAFYAAINLVRWLADDRRHAPESPLIMSEPALFRNVRATGCGIGIRIKENSEPSIIKNLYVNGVKADLNDPAFVEECRKIDAFLKGGELPAR